VTAVVVIEAVVIALLLVLVAGLLKSHAEILRQLHRLEETSGPGRPQTGIEFETAPISQIAGVDPHGTPRVIDLSNGRGNTVLAFLSSGCASCHAFWERLARDHDLSIPDARLVVVTRGAASESPSRIAELAPIDVPVIMSDDAWDRFRVPMTPFFRTFGWWEKARPPAGSSCCGCSGSRSRTRNIRPGWTRSEGSDSRTTIWGDPVSRRTIPASTRILSRRDGSDCPGFPRGAHRRRPVELVPMR
jgi:hypothetical protein